MNWRATYIAAQLAAAAYIANAIEAAAVFQKLGYGTLGKYVNDDHQGYMLLNPDGNGVTFAISGTRASQMQIGDVLDDALIAPTDLGNGAHVMQGTYKGMRSAYAWAEQYKEQAEHLVGRELTWTVVGHSLGGERALLAGLFIDAAKIDAIYAFEAPKCGNDAMWARLAATVAKSTCVMNGEDLWAGWPWISGWSHPPIPHVHLKLTGWDMVGPTSWPLAVSADDHSIDLVVARLKNIADAMPA